MGKRVSIYKLLFLLLTLLGASSPMEAATRRSRTLPRGMASRGGTTSGEGTTLDERTTLDEGASASLQAQPPIKDWTILIYVQADQILNNFAIKNFNDMAKIGSNDRLNIIVQWNQPRKQDVSRYKINKDDMELLQITKKHNLPAQQNKIDFAQDLINFANFAIPKYPAKNYGLIFWNHGIGVVDPTWSQLPMFAVNPATLRRNPRIQLEGITTTTTEVKGEEEEEEPQEYFRGILFDIANQTYLDNQGLTKALSHITTNLTKKKLALVGMDACLMSMLEVFYQIKDFADYSVSSEEVELAQGWAYAPFLYTLAHTSIGGRDLAKTIVLTFENSYKNRTKYYTQSAVDLQGIELLKQNLDEIVHNIIQCEEIASEQIKMAVLCARRHCYELSVPCYIDLFSFYSELKKQLDRLKLHTTHQQTIKQLTTNEAFQNLQKNLSTGTTLLSQTIIANVASPYMSRAKGISIYYPCAKGTSRSYRPTRSTHPAIDPSYQKTTFAQESLWLPFLKENVF